MATEEHPCLKLNSDRSIPVLGLGTWLSGPGQVRDAVKVALECGYRHIDTAMTYGNEAEIGEALGEFFKNKTLTRDQLFITTKLPGPFMAATDVKIAFQESLRKLKLEYVDLYLIHSPVGMKNRGLETMWPIGPDEKIEFEHHDLVACWKEMEDLVDAGLVKSIGISNFNSEQTDRIIKNCRIKPVTNQVECHAYFPQNELHGFLKSRDIVLTAYAPIASPGRPDRLKVKGETFLLEEKVVVDLAKKYSKTPAQILLRNLVQRGMVIVPKSTNPSRIKENSQIFDFVLNGADMAAIAGLNKGQRLFSGASYGAQNHPENPFIIPF